MFARLRLVALAVLALSALSAAVDAKKTGKVLTTNQKQAAQLQVGHQFRVSWDEGGACGE